VQNCLNQNNIYCFLELSSSLCFWFCASISGF